MEFFHSVNIDWMGKAKYFVTLSLVLLAIGWISVWRQGLRYGIDFRGGTLVDVRFATPPPVDRIRTGLQEAGLHNTTITPISDFSDPKSRNDVQISLEQSGKGDEALDADRQAVLDALHKTFGTQTGKPDFNSVTPVALAAYLTQKDPLNLGPAASDRYNQLASRLTDARDKLGIVTTFDDLKTADGVTPGVLNSLTSGFDLGNFAIRSVQSVGPKVGAQLRRQAFWATMYALGGMLIYIAIRFSGGELFLRTGGSGGGMGGVIGRWGDRIIFGAAAVIACFHDVLITLGFFSLKHYEISLTVIAALLTLVGYSMNDTIVIFDRVRENLRLMRRDSFPDIVNKSINQTLSRTILTSGLTLLTVLVLYIMGGEVLRAFSFAMVVGVVVGTYSSFGIAAPLVVVWNKYQGSKGAAVRAGSAAEKRVVAAARR
ncbi:MAG TPA: protein translocase subunit SecF [Candidatus Acidoferrum sp.]|nr:protein translocase subunit SecF [Candidatus Acidoferrum sp.]